MTYGMRIKLAENIFYIYSFAVILLYTYSSVGTFNSGTLRTQKLLMCGIK